MIVQAVPRMYCEPEIRCMPGRGLDALELAGLMLTDRFGISAGM